MAHEDREAAPQDCGIKLGKTTFERPGATPGIEEIQKFEEKRGGKDLGADEIILEHHPLTGPIENKLGGTTIACSHPGTVWYRRRLTGKKYRASRRMSLKRLPENVHVVKNRVANLELQELTEDRLVFRGRLGVKLPHFVELFPSVLDLLLNRMARHNFLYTIVDWVTHGSSKEVKCGKCSHSGTKGSSRTIPVRTRKRDCGEGGKNQEKSAVWEQRER
jgi:hypothetical protein